MFLSLGSKLVLLGMRYKTEWDLLLQFAQRTPYFTFHAVGSRSRVGETKVDTHNKRIFSPASRGNPRAPAILTFEATRKINRINRSIRCLIARTIETSVCRTICRRRRRTRYFGFCRLVTRPNGRNCWCPGSRREGRAPEIRRPRGPRDPGPTLGARGRRGPATGRRRYARGPRGVQIRAARREGDRTVGLRQRGRLRRHRTKPPRPRPHRRSVPRESCRSRGRRLRQEPPPPNRPRTTRRRRRPPPPICHPGTESKFYRRPPSRHALGITKLTENVKKTSPKN
ncbi:unnamed protein product [Nesidiocoris tenuis]|uniref:Uncharacterized protein n=1 Tax=Nesidiocoris tenuis TaxID=355587 RepID=A0A6H5H2L6_9HEMI|nr:unnamed protein product [Nesidiocoris tenuis]